jgi:hypothetical protein
MNTVNSPIGFTPFQLCMGQSPHMILPLVPAKSSATVSEVDAWHIIHHLETDIMEAQDNLLKSKIVQSIQANKRHMPTFPCKIGCCIHLSMLHCRNEYKAKGEKHITKFMLHYDSPYTIIDVDKDHSTVTLDLPNSPNIHPVFHTSEVLPFLESNTSLFPSRKFLEPDLIITADGDEEFYIERILDARCLGCSYQYLVHWRGYRNEHDKWLPSSELQDCQALDDWLASRSGSP